MHSDNIVGHQGDDDPVGAHIVGAGSDVDRPGRSDPADAAIALIDRLNERPLALFPIGYPAADCEVPDLERKPLDEVMVELG